MIKVEQQYMEGVITNGERYNKVIAIWSDVTERVADEMFNEMKRLEQGRNEFNPIFIMADSGARGSQAADPPARRHARADGQAVRRDHRDAHHGQLPRRAERCSQYFISTHGARKGLADTALKTADAGYLTRRWWTWRRK